MVIEKILCFFLSVLLTSNFTIGQATIQVEDEKVVCICDTELSKLKVWRDKEPVPGQELIGKTIISDHSISFMPLIPFMKNGTYVATCGDQVLTWTVAIPEDYEYGEVLGIYPSSDRVPENLLKFNIHFSKPMMNIAYEWIRLLDDEGNEIERAFLSDIFELWRERNTWLSLWIEPGRIKRGLGPNEKLGPVLVEGKEYLLEISANLRDQEGVKTNSVFQKKFTASAADREKPSVDAWEIKQVRIVGKIGLQIDFGEVMDIASASEAFWIDEVEGSWSMLPGERSILFEPDNSLLPGTYTIEVDSKIEDLAGNNLHRLFDSATGLDLDKQNGKKHISITIKP